MTAVNRGSGGARRVALVAGASRGLGLATARALAADGFAVALGARRVDVVQAEAAQLGEAIGLPLDLSDERSVEQAVEQTRTEFGSVDVVVLNGGGPPMSSAASLDLAAARAAAELVLYGPLGLVNAALPEMRERRWGRIIAIGSSGVQQPITGLATSSMFRAALASYLKLLAEEVARDGVTVNMVLPGRILTDRVVELDIARAESSGQALADVQAASQAANPTGRYGRPDELAAVISFLARPEASYVTGEQIRVDGGLIRTM
jgi:3-oxoacyl-[acyl-carrier protein] reductase